ncbi:MAG: hypothetical protein F2772_01120 [Actinobacteria bacterium]|nr:hypothetical protein [Actinomycetota bacterium]MSX54103.1 hypothetical protein [Actinomycetota bacterium]
MSSSTSTRWSKLLTSVFASEVAADDPLGTCSFFSAVTADANKWDASSAKPFRSSTVLGLLRSPRPVPSARQIPSTLLANWLLLGALLLQATIVTSAAMVAASATAFRTAMSRFPFRVSPTV